MLRTYPDLPDWVYEIDEVSAGVYEVVAKDKSGHEISRSGIDVAAIIEDCKRQAAALLSRQ